MGWDIDVKEKVYQRLANEIFFRIYNGTYQLGTKLPSYLNIDIAKEAGSSPETVRKAIRELQDCGVIEKTRLGFFVTSSENAVAIYRQRYLAEVENTYKTKKQKRAVIKFYLIWGNNLGNYAVYIRFADYITIYEGGW